MPAVLSPHEIEAATSLVESGQQRGARELRLARIIAGRPKRIPGVLIPLWVTTADDDDQVARDLVELRESAGVPARTGTDRRIRPPIYGFSLAPVLRPLATQGLATTSRTVEDMAIRP